MTALLAGILFPASLLETQFFQVLALFVAFNTILYVSLAISKMLPRVHLRHRERSANRRPEG
jgi:hypothetical protein